MRAPAAVGAAKVLPGSRNIRLNDSRIAMFISLRGSALTEQTLELKAGRDKRFVLPYNVNGFHITDQTYGRASSSNAGASRVRSSGPHEQPQPRRRIASSHARRDQPSDQVARSGSRRSPRRARRARYPADRRRRALRESRAGDTFGSRRRGARGERAREPAASAGQRHAVIRRALALAEDRQILRFAS